MQARSSAGSEPSRITLVRERLIVLRGAIFSLCVLALICTFGTIARVSTYLRERISKKHSLIGTMLKATACVPPVLLIAFAWYWASKDVHHPDVTDPPIMELVLGEIALLGLIMSIKGVRSRPYIASWTVPVAIFLASLAYSGWLWTEVVYDQLVIDSYLVAVQKLET